MTTTNLNTISEAIKSQIAELKALAENVTDGMNIDNVDEIPELLKRYKYLYNTKDVTEKTLDDSVQPLKQLVEEVNDAKKQLVSIFNKLMEDIRLKIEIMGPESSSVFNWKSTNDYEIVDENQIPEQFWQLASNKLKSSAQADVDVPGMRIIHNAPRLIIKGANIKEGGE